MSELLAKRHAREIEHGARIALEAEDVWGWSTPAGQERARRRARLLLERGRVGPTSTVLELGCGIGIFTDLLAGSSRTLVGVDISLDLLCRARERFAGRDSARVRFERASIERLPHPENAFDAVIGSSILHHLEVAPALTEVHRVLKPGGRFVVAEPNMLNPQIMVQKNVPPIKRWAGDTPDETAFFRWSLARQLGRSGFEEIEIAPYDFLHPAIPPRLIRSVDRIGRFFERLPIFREFAGSLIISASKPK